MSDFRSIPAAASEETSRQSGRVTNRLLAAALVSAGLLMLGAPWGEVRSFGILFLATALLSPASGLYVLTAALWLSFTVPGVLRRLARRRLPGGGIGAARTPSRSLDAAGRRRLSIPREGLEDIGGEFRRDLAEALDIPWRDELLHDHHEWAAASRAAARRRAEGARR